ncbi:hypothetical protein CXB51_034491 [Gossypium anomalum]|uniref:Pentatricopeptide repeat-containing protein n=1 Tax=Gossypium anomalum TaxID=47600 RepID=A0A8J5Y7X5_9ROSI|nr:hypothetical protein CXB51_034491 [Gossypium anomalum]
MAHLLRFGYLPGAQPPFTLIRFAVSCKARSYGEVVQIAILVRNGLYKEALYLYSKDLIASLLPNKFTFPPLFKACAKLNSPVQGQILHTHLIKTGFSHDIYAATALTDMYTKLHCFECALKVFYEMPDRNLASLNTIIFGFWRNEYCNEALILFKDICFGLWRPNSLTIATVLPACQSLELEMTNKNVVSYNAFLSGLLQNGVPLMVLQFGRQVHGVLMKIETQFDTMVGTALVDMYSKCRAWQWGYDFCQILLMCTPSLAVSLILVQVGTCKTDIDKPLFAGESGVDQNTNSEEVNTEQQTVVGSSSVPESLDESVEFQTENGGTRRGQGRTLLTDLYNLNSADRVKVTRNSHGQPVGQEARLLASYLGIIARNANMLSINYESWHNMPDSNKIKLSLILSLEEKLQNVPPGMLRYQWEDAVRFWNSKKGEDRERVGTSSRQKQKFTHTAGSRSFACVAQAAEASSGKKVGRLQLFDITHRKKDGTPMTSEAAEIMTDSSVNFEDIDNRIINEVLGPKRYGRVRFQGSGVNPTQYFGSTSHQYMPSGSQSQAEVQRLKDQIVQIQASTDEQISQLRAEAAAREAEQNRKYNELQLQLQSMMTMFQQFQNPPS